MPGLRLTLYSHSRFLVDLDTEATDFHPYISIWPCFTFIHPQPFSLFVRALESYVAAPCICLKRIHFHNRLALIGDRINNGEFPPVLPTQQQSLSEDEAKEVFG